MAQTTQEETRGTLGTFAGVFTPSILTILGIILFLRLGFVVGSGGLIWALIIILIATAVSILTSISLAAIATNIEVRGGGDYYLISRTIGMEFGGALGIVLFLAQAVSIAFYAIGFGEAVSQIAGFGSDLAVQAVAAIALGFLFILAWLGADWASRFQTVVMGLLIAALVSFYLGAFSSFEFEMVADNLDPPATGLGFWAVFAIFFPAITGFTQGVSMSGDLRDPGRSLPRGTFSAVGLSTLVYLSVAVLFAGTASQSALQNDGGVMRQVSTFGFLIDAGVIAATLSSAMASFLGAPRILQSLASDRIFPFLNAFSKGHGPTNNPRRGVLLALAIALGTVALGNLNLIAPIVSMFFLISYGLLNYATFFEARAKNPSFRPRFRFFHRNASLAGAVGCLLIVVAINVTAGVAAVLVLFGIYQYLKSRSRPERWADTTRAHLFQRARDAIQAMGTEPDHGRNWRPQVLVFSADPERRGRLLQFATWIEGGSGLTVAAEILTGDAAIARRNRDRAYVALKEQIDELGLDTYPLVVEATDVGAAIPTIIQSVGLGPIQINTVLFNRPVAGTLSAASIRSVSRLGANVVMLSGDEPGWSGLDKADRRIDVWWFDNHSSRLALLLAYLCTRTETWRGGTIRVCSAASSEDHGLADLVEYLDDVRIPADVVDGDRASLEEVVEFSGSAGLVFMPIRARKDELLDGNGDPLEPLFMAIPQMAGVLAGQLVELDAGPETGDISKIAEAEQALAEAENRAKTLSKVLDRATSRAADLRTGSRRSAVDRAELQAADAEVEEIRRRLLKAEVRAETARADLEVVIRS